MRSSCSGGPCPDQLPRLSRTPARRLPPRTRPTRSPGTHALLAKVEEPITLQLYFSRSLKNLPVLFKNYATRVEELLRQYAAASGGKIKLVITDPQPDTPEEEAAGRAARARPASPWATAPMSSSAWSPLQPTKKSRSPSSARPAEQFLEYDISKLLHSVQLFNKPKLGLLTSLPLRAPGFQMPGMQPQQPQGQVVVDEWEQELRPRRDPARRHRAAG
ncbi:MAG: Gldg family protein [Gemmobacter sp.]|nr:Gldg family protein [Gemmobacter sp.]